MIANGTECFFAVDHHSFQLLTQAERGKNSSIATEANIATTVVFRGPGSGTSF